MHNYLTKMLMNTKPQAQILKMEQLGTKEEEQE